MSEIWWIEILNMINDYREILYTAAVRFSDEEMQHFPAIAEQLWAEEQGLA